jgi:N-acetylmuramoyl-L-alanine amidase
MLFCPFLRLTGLAGFALLLSAPLARAEKLSPLAPPPDWGRLDAYQRTITHDEFTRLVDTVYSPDGDFWPYTRINDSQVTIYSDLEKTEPLFTLHFAASDRACAPRPYFYRTRADSTDPSRPLQGIKIALDPGHIGGDWAKLEGRYFKLGDDPPVEEAHLAMVTCDLLAERLESDGATIVWAKHGYEPTTDERPDSLHRQAIAALALRPDTTKKISGEPAIQRMIANEAALLFYRVAEIRARAERVNALHPDLTICVHYNADDWGDPDNPTLVGNSRLVIFVNGAYEKSELAFDDMKYDLLRKLLDRDAPSEERGCADVGQAMLDIFHYPPESYTGGYFARHVTDVPSVFARNLMASRLYHGPVIYCEGPYMNARDAYPRIIAGDYLGVRTINGRSYRSIYRDYAEAVEKGVLQYFGAK